MGISYILFAEASKHVSAVEAILIPVIEPLLNPVWVFLYAGEAPGAYAVLGGAVVLAAVIGRSLAVNKLNARKKAIKGDIAL
ncbi:DMT family transporter [Aduncisulcus paluster]|uniref:DMT family transporter n=1 Tax=Aduncisulcus paluster TaxID=2918883 RepID=A0ABQ5KJ69_9EUKA|nr:DMT family transporter [Aduncisulcus paluster]